jgi:SAM-dependent methyltransferase
MRQLWNVHDDSLDLESMPFYWRLSPKCENFPGIASRLPVRVRRNVEHDYLYLAPNDEEWRAIELAYSQDANIGFVNPESGQIATYGASVNQFFLKVISEFKPKTIHEIGCGAGFTIKFLAENGWKVTGIDPSDYSARWADVLGFSLLNDYFCPELMPVQSNFIYCNDVFEHVPEIATFARDVHDSLTDGGVFCIATTNSDRSIRIGDVSMLEHQHVNMFSERSIYSILFSAGFGDVRIDQGSYGNTFHITAIKNDRKRAVLNAPVSGGYFQRAHGVLKAFGSYYSEREGNCKFYVPLRCMPFLASVGDFGESEIYDTNVAWRGKFLDGYAKPIQSLSDLKSNGKNHVFVGSLTFFDEIRASLEQKGYPTECITNALTI